MYYLQVPFISWTSSDPDMSLLNIKVCVTGRTLKQKRKKIGEHFPHANNVLSFFHQKHFTGHTCTNNV